MTDSGRPLPQPPSTPFTRGRRGADDPDQPLTVDRMAIAGSEGRLEEFLDEELGGNAHAKALAAMVMGMSGLAFPGGPPPAAALAATPSTTSAVGPAEIAAPHDVAQAAQAGDVAALADLLKREHALRNPGAGPADSATPGPDCAPGADAAPAPAVVEREVLDALLKISTENGVGVDWLMLRALKLYVADFQRTGRL